VALALLVRRFPARGIRIDPKLGREMPPRTQEPLNVVPTLLLRRADRDAKRPVRQRQFPQSRNDLAVRRGTSKNSNWFAAVESITAVTVL